MKCPKCGFVSYPGLAQCKKCGYVLSSAVAQSGGTHPSKFRSFNRLETVLPPLPPPVEEPKESAGFPAPAPADIPGPISPSDSPLEKRLAQRSGGAWHDELAKRVELFRGRRAHLRGDSETRSNLEFDFSSETSTPREAQAESDTSEPFDFVLDGRTESPGNRSPKLDTVWLGADEDREAPLRTEAAAEWELERQKSDAAAGPAADPVEIVLDNGRMEDEADLVGGTARIVAGPLGARFAAGILDGFVLLLAFALFSVVLWESGGRLGRRPLDAGVMGFAFACFLVLYFGLFTGLAFATPGQSALALQVRTLEGARPDGTSAAWRAVGYLISAAAMMLGFVWSIFDGDRLTWHDHMSGTCLVAVERNSEPG